MDFKTQAAVFMNLIQTRRRNPARRSTVRGYQSYLNAHILPFLGSQDLADIDNGVLKAFAGGLGGLKPATITAILVVTKSVLASAVDSNGNQLYPRVWNADFIDAPVVKSTEQTAPTVAPAAIEKAVGQAKGANKALYALLAGSGLRVGEALALRIGPDDGLGSFWAPETATLTIRTTLVENRIQPSPKTEAGIRVVDLAPGLNDFLLSHLETKEGLLFRGKSGVLMRMGTAYKHLRQAGITEGFHAFRRFRITHMDSVGVPPGLQRFWTGHAAGDTHEIYIKMAGKVSERKEWAERAGLGFQLNQPEAA